MNKTVLDIITLYLKVNKNKEINFIGKTKAFTSQLVKIWVYFSWMSFQKFKRDSFCVGDVIDLPQKTIMVI